MQDMFSESKAAASADRSEDVIVGVIYLQAALFVRFLKKTQISSNNLMKSGTSFISAPTELNSRDM